MTKWISLDLSTSRTGYTIWDDDEYCVSGIIDLRKYKCPHGEILTDSEKKDSNRRYRLLHLYDELDKIIKENNISFIVKEAVIGARNYITAISMGNVHGVVETIKLPIFNVYPTTWISGVKKHLGPRYKGLKTKEYAKSLFVEEMNKIPETDDESDSFSIGYYFIHLVDKKKYKIDYDNVFDIIDEYNLDFKEENNDIEIYVSKGKKKSM